MELETKQLVLAVKQIAEEKNLDEDSVQDVIEQAIAAAYRKDYGEKDQEINAAINIRTGDVSVTVAREAVKEVSDEITQISLDEAKKIKKTAKEGDMIEVIEKPKTFGRVAAQTAKQVILQKLREAEREHVLGEYQDKVGELLNGVIQRVESRVVHIDMGQASGILPQSEQIPGEYYSAGNRIKVVLKEVEKSARGPQLILTRASTEFIEHLFANEVPEMENGAVEIKAIAREAGVRTKIAVESSVPGVDPVGTFVGGHGTRVQAVMGEIGENEKIDIINYDEDLKQFITNALSPTEVDEVKVNEKDKTVAVKVQDDQLSVAIGRGGQNVRLASKLTGYEIDIESDSKTAKPKEEPKANRPKRKSDIEKSLLSAIEEHGEESESKE